MLKIISHMTDGMWVTTGEYDGKKPAVWARSPADWLFFCLHGFLPALSTF